MMSMSQRLGIQKTTHAQQSAEANAKLKTKENPSFCAMYTKPHERMQICWKYQCFMENISTKEKYNKIRSLKNFHKIACKDTRCQLLKQKVFMEG